MAIRSRCPGWILGERDRPAGAGRSPVWWGAGLTGVMADLPTVGRLQVPGEPPSDEASQVVPLAVGELVPEGWNQRGRVLPTHRRGGAAGEVCLRMMVLLERHCVVGTTGPVPAAPQRRL